MGQLETTYNHKKFEEKWWNHWIEGGWFNSDEQSSKEPYSVIIPPPNVTDRLHMGHGLNNTIQDILVRWKRMQGYNCCWLPGTDHAGIATQMMVEKSLEREGVTRQQLGRSQFVDRCKEWKDKNGGIIIDQLKRLGASCDWDREAYTMSPSLSKAVRKIFVELYDKGLIYRGERLVNWDPVLQTAISDDEVENIDASGHLWHYKYQIKGSVDEFITIATTRPETMFGDTAIAVNPEDERYQNFIGKMAIIPFSQREIPIIADEYVKSDFGTGCLKITPAHDPNDFEMGKRHKLPFITVMNSDGSMNDECPSEFVGLDRFEARKKIVQKLKSENLLVQIESIKHTVPYSERSKVAIEPMLSKQWYVSMKELVGPAIKAAETSELEFYPNLWKKTYLHWLNNIQDWCISRQLWWGHRIPIWYCQSCDHANTGMTDPEQCSACGSTDLQQDEDVLDTWFSSWLWPISPFGWPEETKALERFFPSQVLVTGPDIIYLWVARMVMASYFTKDQLPFKAVYFNAIICDKQGRKFSKTLGNGIDPIAVIDKYGADAVRYTCISLAPLGGRVKMDANDFESGHKFVNKIWNAARFLIGQIDDGLEIKPLQEDSLDLPSKWIIHQLFETAGKIHSDLSSYHINEAVESYFHLVWRNYCDWALESAKDAFVSDDKELKARTISSLVYVFEGILRLGAPFMPFVCEEIWHQLPQHPQWKREASLVVSNYPKQEQLVKFSQESEQWELVQAIISSVRSVRTQAGVPPKEKLSITVQCDTQLSDLLSQCKPWIQRLAGVSHIEAGASVERPAKSLLGTGRAWTVYVPVGDFLDFDKERKRLETELKRVEKIVFGLDKKLQNSNFVQRAPADIIESTKAQLENMNTQAQTLRKNLDAIKQD